MSATRPPLRPPPSLPPGSANKSNDKNEPLLKEEQTLASVVPKKSLSTRLELPRLLLDSQESPGNGEPEVNPEIETFPPNRPPPDRPQNSPASPTKIERSLTASGRRPQIPLKSPVQRDPKEQKNSTSFSPPFPMSPRTLVDENSTVDYEQEFNQVAAELTEVLDPEIKTSEKPAETKSESNSPKKKSDNSSKLPTSLEDLSISDISGIRSEKPSARLQKFQLVNGRQALPTAHRRPKEDFIRSIKATQKDPSGTGPESENNGTKNN